MPIAYGEGTFEFEAVSARHRRHLRHSLKTHLGRPGILDNGSLSQRTHRANGRVTKKLTILASNDD